MVGLAPPVVRLLDVDPDLGAGLDAGSLGAATRSSVVGTVVLERGTWPDLNDIGGQTALYMIGGMMARGVRVNGRASAELLGPGQLLRPGVTAAGEMVASETTWRAHVPSQLAVLDQRFWERMAAHSAVVVALLDRALWRSRSLSIRLALVRIPNLAERVLVFLWHLADAYGRVTERGVVLKLPITHETLAELVSASRPSVSKAVKDLERSGRLSQSNEQGFILQGSLAQSPMPAESRGQRSRLPALPQLLEHASSMAALMAGAGV